MNGFYQFTTKIKDTLKLDPFVNTVTYGDIFQVDLSKQTIFPLSHLVVNNVTKESNIMRFNISILAMDIVDMTKDETTDIFIGNDNTQDIWHTQLKVLDRLTELMRRSSIVSEGYQLDGNPTFEQFTERFENYLAGWTVTFDVIVGNDMTICEVGSSGNSCAAAGYIITDSEGVQLYNGTIASGEVGTITVGDSTVENTDSSYSNVILAEGSLVLPDITVNVVNTASQLVNTQIVPSVQDATVSAPDAHINIKKFGDGTIASIDVPSGTTTNYSVADNAITVNSTNGFTIDATDPLDIIIKDSNGSTLTPNSVTPNQGQHKVDIVLPANSPTYASARLLKTGQTTSYRTGDDGDYEAGRGTDFLTLLANNPFGNTNRFTSEVGTQTYTNNIVIDWSTYDGVSVLGYYRIILSDNISWNNAIDLALTKTIGGFSSWRMCNNNELSNICNFGVTSSSLFNYTPFSITSNLNVWCSTTSPLSTTNAFILGTTSGDFSGAAKTTNGPRYIICRTFTVSGTTLS
jgi:hypothetical protein